MTFTRDLWGLALLRRIARALERSNELAQYRIDRELIPTREKRHTPVKITRRGDATEDDNPPEDLGNELW